MLIVEKGPSLWGWSQNKRRTKKEQKNSTEKKASMEESMRAVEREVPPNPHEQLNKYLLTAYEMRWSMGPLTGLKARQEFDEYCKERGFGTQGNFIRRILEVSAGSRITRKSLWRYVQVLQYAWEKQLLPSEFLDFIKKKGGLNRSIEDYQALRRRRRLRAGRTGH